MGGYVNLTVRQGGEVRHRLSYTGALVHFLDVALYDGDRAAIDRLLSHYDDCPEVTDPQARGLVPFDYGIVVLDVDQRVLFDLQSYCDVWGAAAGRNGTGPELEYQLAAYRRGWLGHGPVDAWRGKLIGDFKDLPADVDAVEWLRWHDALADAANEAKRQSVGRQLNFGEHVLPMVRMHPENWTLARAEPQGALAMMDNMQSVAGYTLSERDKAIWRAWHAQRVADRTAP